ncbi:MAG: glycerol-3-phosphate dehydrogenase [Ketobacter sp.]|nr:MAG: glycerol-3-phosphate dehydrogenase [Ketobacter sp.]
MTPSAIAHHHTDQAPSSAVDLFIVGGGINGTGIAAEASARGLKVTLCEQSDLAAATSSASSKLIHGGLRYLEHYEFRLVREALAEREILLQQAPHLIKPLRFVLPHRPHLRPGWMIRIGLFLYDHLSTRNHLPPSRALSLPGDDNNNPLHPDISKAFEYSDCRVDDARLVVTNALAARQQGAEILTRTRCISAKREQGIWKINVMDLTSGQRRCFEARALVNATGPWAQQFIEHHIQEKSPRRIRLIKGSHFVTRKLYEGDHAYILQNEDQRIVFVIPYNDDFTLVGTTDKEYSGNPQNVAMDTEEENYLLDVVNRHFKQSICCGDILWRYSGVRPLCDDESASPSAITRDYTLEIQADEQDRAALMSVFGGKITTYRKLSRSALSLLQPFLPRMQPPAPETTQLPGGDMDAAHYPMWVALTQDHFQWLDPDLCKRLCDAYGTRIHRLLQGCTRRSDLGVHFGAGLYQREVEYLMAEEWAQTAEDILWRRTKLGLRLTAAQRAELEKQIAPAENNSVSGQKFADTLIRSMAV